jgi:hypothetical protein
MVVLRRRSISRTTKRKQAESEDEDEAKGTVKRRMVLGRH